MSNNIQAPRECFSPDYNTRKACRSSCTFQTCPQYLSYWDYLPSYAANGIFLAFFSLSLIHFLVMAIIKRKAWMGFSIAMIFGSFLEILGYAGRVWAHSEPFTENPFLIQIICLTIAPAFYAAGVYFCLSRIVTTFGAENSRLKPKWYPIIFITCDVFSLVLQAAGGGYASAATHSNRDPTVGNNIMIAGLAFQVFTLIIFIILVSDFAFKTWSRVRKMGKEEALDPKHAALRNSFKFRGFLVALAFATLCIFTRCVYRVAELSDGWQGALIKNQGLFIGLEGAVLTAGILALNVFHPAACFSEAFSS